MILGPLPDADEPVYPDVPKAVHREIFKLADWMMRAEPWRLMMDSDVIAVNDPNGGAPWLLSVMGNGGELFALHVYLPDEGTRWYCRLSAEGESPEIFKDAQYNNRLVSLALNDGFDENIDYHDEEIDGLYAPEHWDCIGENSLEFIQLRAQLPGRPPWHPDEEHAGILLMGLRLLKHYYEGPFNKKPGPAFYLEAYGSDVGESVLLPTYTLPAGADANDPKQWKYAVEPYTCPPPAIPPVCPLDDVFVGRLATKSVSSTAVWEAGAIYIPAPFLQDGIPHFGAAAFVSLRGAGGVYGLTLSAADQCPHTRMRQCLEAAANELGVLPAKIVVGSDIARDAFSDLAASRGIKLIRTESDDEMVAFNAAADSMTEAIDPDDGSALLDDFDPEEVAKLRSLVEQAPSPDEDPQGFRQFLDEFSEEPMIAPLLKAFMQSQPPDFDELFGDDGEEENDTPLEYTAPQSTTRYVFRIDIVGAKPPLWRRISIPSDATFFDLHLAIQAAFGWSGEHLHSFDNGDRWGGRITIDWLTSNMALPMLGGRVFHEMIAKIADHFTDDNKVWNYTYDFGDDWEHRIRWEKTITAPAPGNGAFFEVLKGSGAHPIEDCGGIHAYQALRVGDHPAIEHFDDETLARLESDRFDPSDIHLRDPKAEMAILDQMNGNW